MSKSFTYEELEELDLSSYVGGIVKMVEKGADRRWSRTNVVVFEYEDKLYAIDVEEGLTEYQDYYGEDKFPGLDYKTKTITLDEVEIYDDLVPVKKWRRVE